MSAGRSLVIVGKKRRVLTCAFRLVIMNNSNSINLKLIETLYASFFREIVIFLRFTSYMYFSKNSNFPRTKKKEDVYSVSVPHVAMISIS